MYKEEFNVTDFSTLGLLLLIEFREISTPLCHDFTAVWAITALLSLPNVFLLHVWVLQCLRNIWRNTEHTSLLHSSLTELLHCFHCTFSRHFKTIYNHRVTTRKCVTALTYLLHAARSMVLSSEGSWPRHNLHLIWRKTWQTANIAGS